MLLDWAMRHNIDALCLQETETMLFIPEALARTGYTLFHHEKTAILLRTHTAGNLFLPSKAAVWRHSTPEGCYSIAVTLLCPDHDQSTICVASTYIPSNTDHATASKRRAITDHHLRLYAHANSHTYAVLSMDANETNHARGRHLGQTPDLTGRIRYTGNTQPPTHACYKEELADAHLSHNPDLYNHQAGPHLSALTNFGGNQAGYHGSKIDYVFISVNLLARLESCTIDTIPDVVPTTGSYHKPLITTLKWPSLFSTPPPPDHDPLAGLTGRALPTKPNIHALTPALRCTIAEEIDTALSLQLPALRKVLASTKTSPIAKAENLINCLQKTVMRIATNHLGSTTPAATHPFRPTPTPTLLLTWDAAHTAVGAWLENTQVENYPTEPQTVNCILNLAEAGIYIPHNRDNLSKWWHARKHHRDAVLLTPDEIALTDAATERDRKRLYQQMNKHFSSPVATALRRTDGSLASQPLPLKSKPNLRNTLKHLPNHHPPTSNTHMMQTLQIPHKILVSNSFLPWLTRRKSCATSETPRATRHPPRFTPLSSVLPQYNPGTLIP